ncbi:MAG: hypothetical protein KF784_12295 [Fimbriimonadaceae bacterium]|nr:hypothetical protein [Fimbriimonadaceae bacterium]
MNSFLSRSVIAGLLLTLTFSGFAQTKPKQRIALLPIEFKTSYAPKPAKQDEFRAYVQDALENEITKGAQAAGNEMVTATELKLALGENKFKLPGDSKKHIDAFQDLNENLKADIIVYFQLESVSQKSFSPGEVLNNPKLPQSETKVKARIWIYMAKDDLLEQDGDTARESVYGGQYLGTLDNRELTGSPDAKALEITNGIKRRAMYIAKAMMLALKFRDR